MGMEEKSRTKELKEALFSKHENAGIVLDDSEIKTAYDFCEGYKDFLNAAKTEREAADFAVSVAEKNGFTPFDYRKAYTPGDKVYLNNRGKSVILAVLGTDPIENGVNITAAHIDSPRLDLKPNPLYEDAQMALFKTHYYGGIKKYQWTAMPLALHGVIVKANGGKIPVCVGENPSDPVFCVTDLLPHLASEQMKRTLSKGIKGEELNILIGMHPFRDDEESEKVKLNIMQLLNQKYGITENDFVTAELEAVPAIKASDVGFDRSMVGGYGQDDRVCAYTALMAAMETKAPKKTAVTVLADKEEIGSDGNTGLNSAFLKYFIADLAKPLGVEARTVLSNSKCLSADVSAAFDPTFPSVLEKKNAAYANSGVCAMKYSGARGKSGTSDAGAEFFARIRGIFEQNKILWQCAELGAVDEGGGGTVAMYIAALNVDVIDVGVPVLSMHSPFEVASKLDIYMAYKAFKAFFTS